MVVNELDAETAGAIEALAAACQATQMMLVTAESCTGGLIAAACTSVAGSGDWFERGFVTYSNAAKTELLGVPVPLIDGHGAVSAEVASAMAEGALEKSRAQLAMAVTGIAGPSGAVPGKPVGTVWLALAQRGHPTATTHVLLQGDRAAVRRQTVLQALQLLLQRLGGN
jgi:nicotinamide-nucleotide amidase